MNNDDDDSLAAFAALDGRLTGAETLGLAHRALTTYVVFPCPEAADAVTLYAAATHIQRTLEFAARLVLKSPVKRCGKSRLMDVLATLVHCPILTSDISAAALVRSIDEADPPTLMLDEADATFGKALKGDEKAEHLRGILNAGFGRDRPYRRWDVTARGVEECATFAMAVLAGIGDMPDTIEDRAVIITMRRKTTAEPVAKYRIRRDKKIVAKVGEKLARWAAEIGDRAGRAEPAMPAELDDRAQDVWEALLAVADLAGGDWPQRARRAALVLSEARTAEEATAIERLLADLRTVFDTADKMHTGAILDALHKIPEAPWADWYGRLFTARDLAGLLRQWGIRPGDVRIGEVTKKGYRREQFEDSWKRYKPAEEGVSATRATSATSQVSGTPDVACSASHPLHATPAPPVTRDVADVADVAHTPAAQDQDTGITVLCKVCDTPIDPFLVGYDYDTHPGCETEPWPGDPAPADGELPF